MVARVAILVSLWTINLILFFHMVWGEGGILVYRDLKRTYASLEQEIARIKADGRHSVFLLLTDIMKEGSELLLASDDPSVVEKAFGVNLSGDTVCLDGVMSRKKQVVPNFEKAFK